MPLLKQLAHCPDKRQHSPTNTNSWVSVRQQLVFVGYCRVLSEEFNITCSVGLGKVAECLPNEHSDSSQLGSTRVHNILELSLMSLLCWLSASLLKKKRYPKSIYRLTLCISLTKRTVFQTDICLFLFLRLV